MELIVRLFSGILSSADMGWDVQDVTRFSPIMVTLPLLETPGSWRGNTFFKSMPLVEETLAVELSHNDFVSFWIMYSCFTVTKGD